MYKRQQQENLKTDFAKSKVDWTSIATNEDFSKALLMLFKQKTAYEMESRDWSSDVCSSDLTDLICFSLSL